MRGMRLVRIRGAKPLNGRRFELTLTEIRENAAAFRELRVEGGTLVWPNGADLCHDVLIWGGSRLRIGHRTRHMMGQHSQRPVASGFCGTLVLPGRANVVDQKADRCRRGIRPTAYPLRCAEKVRHNSAAWFTRYSATEPLRGRIAIPRPDGAIGRSRRHSTMRASVRLRGRQRLPMMLQQFVQPGHRVCGNAAHPPPSYVPV